MKTAPSGETYCDVHMIASCQSSETCCYTVAHGGDFTNQYIIADSSKHNLVDTTAHLAKLTVQSIVQGATFPSLHANKGINQLFWC